MDSPVTSERWVSLSLCAPPAGALVSQAGSILNLKSRDCDRQKRSCPHGAILKVVTTNICGSDQHMVRGRTSLPGGHMVLGHEITGEVIETGPGCEFINVVNSSPTPISDYYHIWTYVL